MSKRHTSISDYHIHSHFSHDSRNEPRELIEEAITKGLKAICITDHNDKDYPLHLGYMDPVFDIDEYYLTFSALRKEYRGRIDLRIGVEIGLQPHLVEYFNAFTGTHPLDYILGSVHVVNGTDPYSRENFIGRSDEEVYMETFLVTLENITLNVDFDVLGHLDYVTRYGTYQDRDYSYEKFADHIDSILRKLITDGRGIELNTAGFKHGLPYAHPHSDILKRYRELGGEIITVGSDAHRPGQVAYEFDKAKEILLTCGFAYYTEFKERKPNFCKII